MIVVILLTLGQLANVLMKWWTVISFYGKINSKARKLNFTNISHITAYKFKWFNLMDILLFTTNGQRVALGIKWAHIIAQLHISLFLILMCHSFFTVHYQSETLKISSDQEAINWPPSHPWPSFHYYFGPPWPFLISHFIKQGICFVVYAHL